MKSLNGSTLIEMIMVLVILCILGGTSTILLDQFFLTYPKANAQLRLTTPTNSALTILLRELSSARSVTNISDTSITFVNQNSNTVTYTLNETQLLQSINGDANVIALDHVSTFTLAYYDQSFANTSIINNICLISVLLDTNDDNIHYIEKGSAILRNMLGS